MPRSRGSTDPRADPTDPRARSFVRQLGRLVVDATREPPALWAIQAADYLRYMAKTGFPGFAEMLSDSVEEKLAAVEAPTLVVRGSRDPIVPHAWVEKVAHRLPHGRLVEIPSAAHAVNYTAADALSRLTLSFLAEGVISEMNVES